MLCSLVRPPNILCFYKYTFYSQILVIPQSSSVKMNHPDEKMFYFVFQIIFLLTCLVTANSLYFVFRRYKVFLKINVWIILTNLYIYQDSLPDHKQVIVNILFDQLSLLFQSGNIICGSYILMVWQVHMTKWQSQFFFTIPISRTCSISTWRWRGWMFSSAVSTVWDTPKSVPRVCVCCS